MSATRAPKPLYDLARKSAATRRLKADAEAMEAGRNKMALVAFDDGFTYQQIADAMGVSLDRVTQVLRKERRRQA
jgi:DNA-directed RNA polymerase specialized sigma24 family protein